MARTHQPFPWEAGHAAPQDRALGLELELIELVRRRREVGDTDSDAGRRLDAEIDRTLAELDEVTRSLPLAV